ncbi:MAG: Stk1 family PASTA domain-containing Ser/Thr kinase [Defluviitaleaceae bacterium]|nr:Stk1 family PASTA domain-containing Ser/Thr kinase [Defluviitaleaceae bacterium]
MKLKAGQMVAERYEIDDILGSGGMSVVYRAHDTKLDRFVTLKILKEDYLNDEALMERFPHEARAAAALNHQNITAIFDHGRDGDVLYIVLEYVDGASLKELIVKKAPFDDETNLGVAIQVAEGLSEAHYNKIIHLDVKPQNILITTTSIVKVADFGIARAAKSVTLNAAAGSMGSVHYFSPEQARGGYIDHKSDIYSLGIVMYEMATGQLPFEGENEVAVALQHINDPLPDISKINTNVSESVIKIIQKATEKSASKRYETVDDMIDDLKRALTDASGSFVQVEKTDVMSETRRISEENKEAVRRQKMRAAFLDGTDMPEDDYEDDYENEPEDGGFMLRGDAPPPRSPQHVPQHPPPRATPQRAPQPQRAARQYEDEYVPGQEYADDDYYEVEPPPPPRDKKADRVSILGGIILGLLFGLPIIIGAVFIYSRFLSPTAGMIETPDMVGQTRLVAEIEARNRGLVLDISEEICGVQSPFRDESYSCGNDDCEGECEGLIIFQSAVADTMLNPGDILHIVVSAGRPSEGELMPRVEGFTLDDARARLAELDVRLIIETDYRDDVSLPRNFVHVQDPPTNSRLAHGDIVTLTVTPGQADVYVAVPVLTGRTEDEAHDILRNHSLVGIPEREYSDTFGVGLIIRQYPAPGELVERDVTIVTYYISRGPETPTQAPTPTPDPEESDDENVEANDNDAPESPETPEETPVETPTPEPEIRTGVLTVHLWPGIPEGAETVHLMILRQLGNGDLDPIHNNPNERISEFPRSFQIQYSDPSVFHIVTIEDGVHRTIAIEHRPSL